MSMRVSFTARNADDDNITTRFSLSLPHWRSMLCALVVFAISFLSRMEESAEHRSVAVVTRVDCLQGLWRVDYG